MLITDACCGLGKSFCVVSMSSFDIFLLYIVLKTADLTFFLHLNQPQVIFYNCLFPKVKMKLNIH